jgi:hypothetical protein
MLLSESKKHWKKYGLNSIKENRILHISEILVDLGDDEVGLKATYNDYKQGIRSKTNKPLSVLWLLEENKFLLVDGYHRLLEGLIKKQENFQCTINWQGFTLLWKIPVNEEIYIHGKHKLWNY